MNREGIFCVFALIGFTFLIGAGIDNYFDNQDRMLCESATISGNEEYLKKCDCYYEGQDIRCIYEGIKWLKIR